MNGKYIAASIIVLLTAGRAYAGSNDFFGGMQPGGTQSPMDSPVPSGVKTPPGATTDNSDDEKKMQRKYKDNLAHAHDVVEKADAMIKRGEAKHDDKMTKKGKILKEIGEKQISELQANIPAPTPREKK